MAEIHLIPDSVAWDPESLTWWVVAHVKWQKANLKCQMWPVPSLLDLPFAFCDAAGCSELSSLLWLP